MADIPNTVEASELLREFTELAEQQKAIEALRRQLVAARCKQCQRFGAVLRVTRKRHGVTQRVLSHGVGYQHASKVAKWEASTEFPRRDELTKIISAVHC